MSEAPLPPALENFLEAPPQEPLPGALDQALRMQTAALLPKWRRRIPWLAASAVAAGLAAAFVAGYLLGRSQEPERRAVPEPQHVEPAPPPAAPPPAVVVKAPTASELEWQAFDTMDDRERARLYFLAGDLYLANLRDYASASRCYGQALRDCDPQDREIKPEDNYLVAMLKLDYKEK
jgi:hypothetical protein